MADEAKKTKNTKKTGTEETEPEEKDNGTVDHEIDATELATVEDEAAKALATIEANPERPVVTVADINLVTLGELVLSYAARDVTLILDGATAARVLAAYARPERRGRLQDYLDIETSTMRNQWASFDLENLLAVHWYPGIPSRATSRMTVDPPSHRADAEGSEVAIATS